MTGRTRLFLLLAFALTWIVWVPRALAGDDPGWTRDVAPLSTYGPALAAVLAAALTGGRTALRELGGRLVRWRVGARWWLAAVAGPAGVWLVAAQVHLLVAGEVGATPQVVGAGTTGLLALLPLLLLTDGVGEEVGWRGYALPQALRRSSPATVSLLIGLVWALWHAPLAWTDGALLEGTAIWLLALQLPVLAVLHTWVFLGTGGSALTAVVLHTTTSLFGVQLPGDGSPWSPYLVQLAVQAALAAAVLASWRRDRWEPGHDRAGDGRPGQTVLGAGDAV